MLLQERERERIGHWPVSDLKGICSDNTVSFIRGPLNISDAFVPSQECYLLQHGVYIYTGISPLKFQQRNAKQSSLKIPDFKKLKF
jgi:hypothetical protein